MLKNQEILKKLIIEKIPNVKKINLKFFPVFPDVRAQKEPKIVKKCQFLALLGLFYEIYIWEHWKKFRINFFDIWNFFYNELFQNFLIFKHFLYMLVPKMIHYSKTVDVQPLNF